MNQKDFSSMDFEQLAKEFKKTSESFLTKRKEMEDLGKQADVLRSLMDRKMDAIAPRTEEEEQEEEKPRKASKRTRLNQEQKEQLRKAIVKASQDFEGDITKGQLVKATKGIWLSETGEELSVSSASFSGYLSELRKENLLGDNGEERANMRYQAKKTKKVTKFLAE